jgi:hypothetical protein
MTLDQIIAVIIHVRALGKRPGEVQARYLTRPVNFNTMSIRVIFWFLSEAKAGFNDFSELSHSRSRRLIF